MKLIFPHISRFISAGLLWILLIGLFFLNARAAANTPLAYSDKIFSVYSNPLSWKSHTALARDLWDMGQKALAINEITLAQKLVLGASTAPSDLLMEWQAQPTKQDQQKQYWQDIIKKYPDYRDGYIALALIYTSQKNFTEARSQLMQAQTLDPDNSVIEELLRHVQSR